jgi:cytochrome P450
VSRASSFFLGAGITLAALEGDPHPHLARLRTHEPVSWLPVLDGWLATRYDLALAVMRDAATFTVDDPRFSTGQVIGPSMLTLDGREHDRHRAPFVAPFRPHAVEERFAAPVAEQAERLIERLAPAGEGELRRGFAGPLAASIITGALGLGTTDSALVLSWYDAIVGAVTDITAGGAATPEAREAFAELRERSSIGALGTLSAEETASNAAVLLFGGIETTEGMIANALLHLLERPEQLALVRDDDRLIDAAIEESLRLEPAAAVIDRYATTDTRLATAEIKRGELVRISIAGANRDPAVFDNPDEFDLGRKNARRQLAFAQGPHVCLGVHLARLEARTALAKLLQAWPGIRLDPERPSAVRGLVFRKPPTLFVRWD